MHRSQKLSYFFSVTFVVIILDSLTKLIAFKTFSPPNPLDSGLLHFTLTFNKGAIFGFGENFLPFMFFLAVGLGIAIMSFFVVVETSRMVTIVGAGLFTGGMFGNLIDRSFRGETLGNGSVIDFIQVSDWFVFNLADVCITAGLFILGLSIVFPEKHKEKSVIDQKSTTEKIDEKIS